MKKMVVIVMVLWFTTVTISAKFISFGLGAQMLFHTNTIEELEFGGEVRLEILFAEGVVSLLYESDNRLTSLVTVGTSINLFDLLHIGLGLGPALSIEKSGGDFCWGFMDTSKTYQKACDLNSGIRQGLVHYRMHGDIKLGRISLGMTYLVPSKGYTLHNSDVSRLGPDWEEARVGASVLFWLF